MTTRFPTEQERKKRARLDEMLNEGLVLVHLDARHEGVDVPEHLKSELALILSLSRRFGLEVFELGPLAVRASLSFGGVRHMCVLPWEAIFGLTIQATGAQTVFPESLPTEIRVALQSRSEAEASEVSGIEEELEGSEVEDLEPPGEDSPPEDDPPPRGGHLRLVK